MRSHEALGRGDPVAWMLVLSPYVVIQLVRLAWKTLRYGKTVTEITVSARDR